MVSWSMCQCFVIGRLKSSPFWSFFFGRMMEPDEPATDRCFKSNLFKFLGPFRHLDSLPTRKSRPGLEARNMATVPLPRRELFGLQPNSTRKIRTCYQTTLFMTPSFQLLEWWDFSKFAEWRLTGAAEQCTADGEEHEKQRPQRPQQLHDLSTKPFKGPINPPKSIKITQISRCLEHREHGWLILCVFWRCDEHLVLNSFDMFWYDIYRMIFWVRTTCNKNHKAPQTTAVTQCTALGQLNWANCRAKVELLRRLRYASSGSAQMTEKRVISEDWDPKMPLSGSEKFQTGSSEGEF